MGLFSIVAKIAGTAVLGATGTASAVLKSLAEVSGVDIGSELFGAAKDASFNGIKQMWASDDEKQMEEFGNLTDNYSNGVENSTRSAMASTARRMAEAAKQAGDMEKYEKYMEKYRDLR